MSRGESREFDGNPIGGPGGASAPAAGALAPIFDRAPHGEEPVLGRAPVAHRAPVLTPPPLPDTGVPFQLGLDGEMLDWPTTAEAGVSIVADGVQLSPPKPPGPAAPARGSLRARLASVIGKPQFDAAGYAGYHRHIEEAMVEIVHREPPPKAGGGSRQRQPSDPSDRFLKALKGN
jgi:hypothetical protein